MYSLNVFLILIFSLSSFADTKLIFNNHPFDLVEQKKLSCGSEKGDPEYLATILLLNTSQRLAENTRGTKAGIESIFGFVRQYPSRFSSTACMAVRDECESRCINSNQFAKDDCKIECNQYESWNK